VANNLQTRHPLGLFQYSTYDEADYVTYLDTYANIQPPPQWFFGVSALSHHTAWL
jgi:hypothetical protein